jgi:glycosyltransferase involved in cell wall biosynthesis
MAVGEVVVTMDADLQDSPEEIPDLRKMILVDGFDLVSGWKKKRYDPISKTIPTKLFNWTTRKMSGIYLHDFNCGLKIYRKNVIKSLEIFGEMHRYIPVMAHKEGFRKIGEKVVEHRARKYGVSKFGLERFINGFLDLLTITFISRFGKKPMHFFGSIGLLMFIIGFTAFTYIGGSKLWALFNDEYQKNIADQSIFYIALTAMIIGTQLFMAGFVGELITRNSSRRNDYKITEII